MTKQQGIGGDMSKAMDLAPDAAWTKGNLPCGMITVAGKPMLYWLPSGVLSDDVFPGMPTAGSATLTGFDDSDQTPFDDDSGLVDDEVAA